MRELPRVNIYDDFYIWFDLEEKKEHYATPLYLYNVKRDRIDPNDETRLYLKLEKDISKTKLNKKKEIIRQPSTIYIHYVESIGAILINFLNADFTNYETAYNTFFYAYGYELVKDYVPYSYTQKDKFIDNVEFKRIIKDIYDTGSDKFIEWQENFRKCVDFVYNLNGNEELKEEDKLAKFIAYTIKDNDFYTYSQEIEIITDTYINIHNKYHNETLKNLIDRIKNKDQELELHNVYTSKNLTSICFAVLDQIVRHENLQIKTCLNCGRYFIPNYRQNEIYCDLANVDQSPTCKEKGANEQYKKNLENNKAQALYRRIYRQKFMIAQRNKDSKTIQKEFEQWKREAKDKVNKMKKGKLTEERSFKRLSEDDVKKLDYDYERDVRADKKRFQN